MSLDLEIKQFSRTNIAKNFFDISITPIFSSKYLTTSNIPPHRRMHPYTWYIEMLQKMTWCYSLSMTLLAHINQNAVTKLTENELVAAYAAVSFIPNIVQERDLYVR